MKECFECKAKNGIKPTHMFLIKCYYDDYYGHYDGEEKERWICRSCLLRRLGIKEDTKRMIQNATLQVKE